MSLNLTWEQLEFPAAYTLRLKTEIDLKYDQIMKPEPARIVYQEEDQFPKQVDIDLKQLFNKKTTLKGLVLEKYEDKKEINFGQYYRFMYLPWDRIESIEPFEPQKEWMLGTEFFLPGHSCITKLIRFHPSLIKRGPTPITKAKDGREFGESIDSVIPFSECSHIKEIQKIYNQYKIEPQLENYKSLETLEEILEVLPEYWTVEGFHEKNSLQIFRSFTSRETAEKWIENLDFRINDLKLRRTF